MEAWRDARPTPFLSQAPCTSNYNIDLYAGRDFRVNDKMIVCVKLLDEGAGLQFNGQTYSPLPGGASTTPYIDSACAILLVLA